MLGHDDRLSVDNAVEDCLWITLDLFNGHVHLLHRIKPSARSTAPKRLKTE